MKKLLKLSGAIFYILFTFSAFSQTMEMGDKLFQSGQYEDAFKIYKELATKGDAEAQFNLGLMYLKGLSVEENIGKALEWYLLSAENGFAPGQFNASLLLLGEEEGIDSAKFFNFETGING